MAHIIGTRPGLVPVSNPVVTKRPTKRGRKVSDSECVVTEVKAAHERFCDACGGDMGPGGFKETRVRGRRAFVETTSNSPRCSHCTSFFGRGILGGMTNVSPTRALEVVNAAREAGYVMLLRHGVFGSKTFTLRVEPGDVFKVSRAGVVEKNDSPTPCSKERTWQKFTVSVRVAGEELIQLPHEVSGISFVRVMELRAAEVLSEVYVSTDDQDGHFAPPPKVRESINAAFRNLV